MQSTSLRAHVSLDPIRPRLPLLLATCLVGLQGMAAGASFTAGNIAVLQAAASISNTTCSVVEVNPASVTPLVPVQTIAIDGTTLPGALRFSGSATSTGYLANSNDRGLLVFAGHNSTATTGNANTLLARGVGTLNAAGTFALATTYTGSSGNQTRSATSLNNSDWFIGDQGGLYTNGTTTASPAINVRGVKSFGGTVYGLQASATGTIIAVSTISAATGGTVTGLPGLTNNSAAQDFTLISSGDNGSSHDVLYLLSATSNTAGTISKYSLVSGTWTANGSYTTAFGGFGLVASDSGNGATLFVSTGQGALAANNLLKVTDTAGYNAPIAVTTGNNVILYTAPAGNIIKGVAFAPVNTAADLTISVTAPANGVTGTNFDYTVTAANTGATTATGVGVQLTLPSGLNYVSAGVNNGFTASESSGVVTFSGGTLNSGSSAVLTVTVSASTASTYAAAAGAAVIDPSNTVAESNETNNSSSAGTSTVVVVPNSPPFFTLQPAASTLVPYGATTTLTVSASGNPTPTLQWYEGASGNTSSPVSGATSDSFTTPAITANTSYWVRASNGQGSPADSNTASITVQLSSDATLSALVLSSGTLSPAFASGTTSYTASVSSSSTTLTVTPTVTNSFATLQARVNGGSYSPVNSGSPSGPLALNVGTNLVEILVTAQDGTSPAPYAVTVTRFAPSVLTTGDLTFTAINADEDGFAMVALKDIPANTAVYFTDNEWDGSAFNTGERYHQWSSGTSLIPAGTVIRFLSVDATPTASFGTLGFVTVAGSPNPGLSQGGETLYAYVADTVTSTPTFLAAISTITFDPDAGTLTNGKLLNTGLTLGNGAIQTGLAAGSDFAEYTSSRSNQTTFAAYLAEVSNIANWNDSGDGSYAATVPDTTPFSLGGAATATLLINDVSVTEGNSGTTTLNFTVTRNNSLTAFTVDYATADGSATQPGDYATASGTLTFTVGGTLTQSMSVTVQGDTTLESDETVLVNLSNVVNSSGSTAIADAQGIGTILNDEPVITTPLASSNRDVLVPNTNTWPAAGVSLNGAQFVNLGLQGVGRVPANSIDPATGESLGSISDMQVTGFTNNNNGTWSGTFNFLPDRGYNSGAIFSNYAARINAFSFTFTPYTSAAPTGLQNQVAMTFTGSERFTYDHDANNGTSPVYTTGLLANGKVTLFGTDVPIATGNSTQSDATVANRLTVDAEGLVLDKRSGRNGTGWVGDEYGAYIYHFNASKQIDGQLLLPAALVPHSPVGTTNFQADPPVSGRRINQGMEGLAQSPDGTRLFALLQSATLQDSGAGNQGRTNTRLLVYDISGSDTPSNPIAQYVIQLPRIDTTGSSANGNTVDRTGAQSCIQMISNTQFLVLARDGNGRGASGAPVFKSVLLADISAATNIDGTYDAEGNAVAPGGVLNASVTPIAWTEALNMIGKLDLNISEVAKFGLNLNTAPGDINSICEKWEAIGMVSCDDGSNPNDYFLFIGNDNDFISASGKYLDAAGTVQSYNAGLENDTMVLAYRVRLIQPSTPVNAWRQSNFGTTTSAGNLANDADFDNDGIENLVEYALGTNPTVGSGVNGPAALPVALHNDPDPLLSDRLALSFSLANPNPTDVTYVVQASDDLGSWTSVASKTGSGAWIWLGGGTSRIVTSGSGPVSVKVGDLVPASGNPIRTMRLKVNNP